MNAFVDDNTYDTRHDDFRAPTDGFSPVGEDALKRVSGGAGVNQAPDTGGVEGSSPIIGKLMRLF
jgi:hypothetical protein